MSKEDSAQNNFKSWLPIAVVALLALMAGLGLAYFLKSQAPTSAVPALGGDFTLQSAHGPVSLADFKNKVVTIYFGYTFCPDACPTTLAAVGAGIKALSDKEQQQVQAIFISVDPERDSPEHLAAYVSNFDSRMVGLTGTAEELQAVNRKFGAIYRLNKSNDQDRNYFVDHSSRLYVMGRDGRLAALLDYGVMANEITKSLRDALKH